MDESYFCGVRKGKRGRGAAGKVPVFGLLKRGGKVYAQIIDEAKTNTLLHIIREKVVPIVYTDGFKATPSMFPNSNTIELIIRKLLLKNIIT
jgi:transposase